MVMTPTPLLTTTAALALTVGVLLSGCTQTVALRPAANATDPGCASIITRLPETVAGFDVRETNAQGTGAWGSPSVVLLRCGVAVPEPTASLTCVTVDGIDWLRDPADDPSFVFTTYGRDPATEVVIDSREASGGSVLTDLSAAIGVLPAERNCISPDDVLEGGQPVE